MFYPFIDDAKRRADRRRGGRRGLDGRRARRQPDPGTPRRAARQLQLRPPGRRRPDPDVHSISAGLDYPGVGPEHSYWKDIGRVRYESITDAEALDAYNATARHEGILPALESSHALAQAFKEAQRLGPGKVVVVCLSGRGDKDAYEVARLRGEPI